MDEADDPYLWLEESHGAGALAWARAQTARSVAELEADSRFPVIVTEMLAVHTAEDRIPYGDLAAGMVYSFWQDGTTPRRVMRRATVDSYCTAEPVWNTLLDVDALAEAEGEDWTLHGWELCPPDHRRCWKAAMAAAPAFSSATGGMR